jgi:hypothetical protein
MGEVGDIEDPSLRFAGYRLVAVSGRGADHGIQFYRFFEIEG